jgi:hypothetical protein
MGGGLTAGAKCEGGDLTPSQLVMPETIPGSYWVHVTGHLIWPDGTRFLVVEERGDGWLRC